MGDSSLSAGVRASVCPAWCTTRHGVLDGEEDDVHVGGALQVKQAMLQLCATIDARTGAVEGPHILYGSEELSLHEAEALIGALTQLVEQGSKLSDHAAG